MVTQLIRGTGILACALALTGCWQTADVIGSHVVKKFLEPKPTRMEATFEASPGLNPDPSGRPSPIVIRLYELTSLAAFENADFFALYEDGMDLLGEDLQYMEVLEFNPGEQTVVERELHPETLFVGIVAAYRDIEHAAWRSAAEVQPGKKNPLVVKLDPLAVSVAPPEDD